MLVGDEDIVKSYNIIVWVAIAKISNIDIGIANLDLLNIVVKASAVQPSRAIKKPKSSV